MLPAQMRETDTATNAEQHPVSEEKDRNTNIPLFPKHNAGHRSVCNLSKIYLREPNRSDAKLKEKHK